MTGQRPVWGVGPKYTVSQSHIELSLDSDSLQVSDIEVNDIVVNAAISACEKGYLARDLVEMV